jgi:hypothetical protein
MYWIIGYVIFHIVCWVFAAGLLFAFLQKQWPIIARENYQRDLCYAYILGVAGPASLFALFFTDGFRLCGIKFW